MNEVYFGGDGCATCGRAIREPWNRPHAEWCAEVRARLRRESEVFHGGGGPHFAVRADDGRLRANRREGTRAA